MKYIPDLVIKVAELSHAKAFALLLAGYAGFTSPCISLS